MSKFQALSCLTLKGLEKDQIMQPFSEKVYIFILL